jgi:predicted RNA-binding Zn ribbon-like protein
MTDRRTAPHDLDLVIDFVNTLDLEKGEAQLADPVGLSSWLSERGLLPAGAPASAADLREARALREALRSAMLAHNGAEPDPRVVTRLDEVARRGRLGVQFAGAGARLAPAAAGPAGALAALLVPVATAMGDGTWERVKGCRADDCHWAFYDFSRNRSGTWCEMAVCGNREKVRAFRGRGG